MVIWNCASTKLMYTINQKPQHLFEMFKQVSHYNKGFWGFCWKLCKYSPSLREWWMLCSRVCWGTWNDETHQSLLLHQQVQNIQGQQNIALTENVDLNTPGGYLFPRRFWRGVHIISPLLFSVKNNVFNRERLILRRVKRLSFIVSAVTRFYTRHGLILISISRSLIWWVPIGGRICPSCLWCSCDWVKDLKPLPFVPVDLWEAASALLRHTHPICPAPFHRRSIAKRVDGCRLNMWRMTMCVGMSRLSLWEAILN